MAEIRGKVLSNRRGGNVAFDVDQALAEDRRLLGRTIRKAIAQSPYWPVRTGKSRGAFWVRLLKSGIIIGNRYRYAYIVEATHRRPRYPITETVSEAIEQEARSRPGGLLAGFRQGFSSGVRIGG